MPDPADKKNALASPFLVKRAELPKNVFLVGCQKDVLWPEANRMCERLSREVVKRELRLKRDGNKVVFAGVCYQKWGMFLTCGK